jgi:hypothetical protein
MEFQSLMTLSEYKLCLNDGILDSGINNFQVTFFFRKYDTFLTYSVGFGVVINKDRPCIQRMIVKVRHNTCFKDVLPIDLSIEVSSYSSPHHD